MGEAKRRKAGGGRSPTAELEAIFNSLNIDYSQFGFYDSPEFMLAERDDRGFLNRYGEWVFKRSRSAEYDEHVRRVVPIVANIMFKRLEAGGVVRSCLNVSGALAKMLDRLGVWSCAIQGACSATSVSNPAKSSSYYLIDQLDHPQGITGHVWVCAPPFCIVDVTLAHQGWAEEDKFTEITTQPVLIEKVSKIAATVTDVMPIDFLRRALMDGSTVDDVITKFAPDLLASIELFGACEKRIGDALLRYIPGTVGACIEGLADIKIGEIGLRAGDIWNDEIAPAFNVSKLTAS